MGYLAQLRETFRFAPVRPALAAGLRAAIATTVPLAVGLALGNPSIASWTSLGGFNASLVDKGGAYGDRARVMALAATLSAIGCVIGAIAGRHPILGLLLVVPWVTLCGLARVYGAPAAGAGTVSAVVFVVSLSRPTPDFLAALAEGGWILAGSAWAMALSLGLWPVRLYRPARMSVGRCWRMLAEHAAELSRLEGGGEDTMPARLRIRAEIEEARSILSATRRGRQAEDPRGERLVVLLTNAERTLGSLVALADLVERGGRATGSTRFHLRELEEIGPRIAEAVEERARELPAFTWPVAPLGDAVETGLLRDLRANVDAAWDAAHELLHGHLKPLPRPVAPEERRPWYGPLLDNLHPGSEVLRHAVRAGIAALVAVWITDYFRIDHGYWVSLTVIAILQPHTSATFVRGLQRVAGTVVGGAVAALLASTVKDVNDIIPIVFLFSGASVAVLPLNYGVFSVFLTPAFVLLAEVQAGNWELAEVRIANTLLGAGLALVAARLLWPRWEKETLPETLAAVLRASAAFLRTAGSGSGRGAVDGARRQVGLALVNADASFQRALSEPGFGEEEAAAWLGLLTYARRYHGSVTALVHAPRDPEQEAAFRSFAVAAAPYLDRLADDVAARRAPSPLPALPEAPSSPQLARVERQLAIVRDAAATAR